MHAISFRHAIQHYNRNEKPYEDLNTKYIMVKSMMFHI